MLGNAFVISLFLMSAGAYLEDLLIKDQFYSRIVHAFWETLLSESLS